MTREEMKGLIREVIQEIDAEQAKKICQPWSIDAQIESIRSGVFQPTQYQNGDRKNLIDRPACYVSREELAVVVHQLLQVIEDHEEGDKICVRRSC